MKKINHYQGDTLDFHKDVVNSKRNTADDKNKKKSFGCTFTDIS